MCQYASIGMTVTVNEVSPNFQNEHETNVQIYWLRDKKKLFNAFELTVRAHTFIPILFNSIDWAKSN